MDNNIIFFTQDYQSFLMNYAKKLIRQEGIHIFEAEDLLQETNILIHTALKKGMFSENEVGGGHKAWGARVMHNTMINLVRSYRSKHRFTRYENLSDYTFESGKYHDSIEFSETDVEKLLILEQEESIKHKIVKDTLTSLDNIYVEVLALRHQSGSVESEPNKCMKYEKIAELTGLCLNTVKTRIHYGRKHMQKIIKEKYKKSRIEYRIF